MTTSVETVPLLTDDEVAALAVLRRIAWPTQLPTVDVVEQDLLAAAARGRRSLLVRGLLQDEDGELRPSADIAPGVDALLERPVQLVAYVGRDDLSPWPTGFVCTFFGAPGEGDWVTETVSADGVHALESVTVEEAVRAASNLLRAAHEDGVPGDAEPAAEARMVVLRPGQPPRAIIAGHARLAAVELVADADTGPQASDQQDVSTVDEALALLGL